MYVAKQAVNDPCIISRKLFISLFIIVVNFLLRLREANKSTQACCLKPNYQTTKLSSHAWLTVKHYTDVASNRCRLDDGVADPDLCYTVTHGVVVWCDHQDLSFVVIQLEMEVGHPNLQVIHTGFNAI